MIEHGTAPAVLQGLASVPLSQLAAVETVKQAQIVAPGDLCNKLMHKCLVRPGLREGPHVLEVASAEPAHVDVPIAVTQDSRIHSGPTATDVVVDVAGVMEVVGDELAAGFLNPQAVEDRRLARLGADD